VTCEIDAMWQLFPTGPEAVHELRAIHYVNKKKVVTRVFRAKEFGSTDDLKKAFALAATELNQRGFNIYVNLNPINSDFSGRAARDKDIAYRDLLLIDIDRIGNTKQPAPDEEIEKAKDLGCSVSKYLENLGWPNPIRVMSGNGVHLYYELSGVDNDASSESLIKRTINNLASRFKDPEVGIDGSVFNASRITKVPGTIMRKGQETEERPYRMAVLF
jgi:hypothetical protein